MSRRDFQGITDMRKAALKRLNDAKALLDTKQAEHAQGAKYLAGYAIECKLKAMAMEVHGCRKLDELTTKLHISENDVYAHGLEQLAGTMMSHLLPRLMQGEVGKKFARVNQWKPAWRYSPWSTVQSAKAFLNDVQCVYTWLSNNS